ncbi:MAG: ribosomal protein [Candidatus Berkelbacteria bacterium]|nr:ribosomal protein [Candidatus Berkelbacteria bacterium]
MDPIAEMFCQIVSVKNTEKDVLVVPFSNIKMAILEILKNTGKIKDFKKINEKPHDKIEINPNNLEINKISRISTPGKRVYSGNGNIPVPKTQHGLIIISTSEGIMAGEDARKKGIGGEIICEVS